MFWRFEFHTLNTEPLPSQYSVGLVGLAVFLAVFAAFLLLPLIDCYRASRSRRAGSRWILAGALIMGFGIWSTQITLMLTRTPPTALGYAPWLTLAALVPATVGCAVTILTTRLRASLQRRLLLSALALGLGLVAMHYIAMEAIIAPLTVHYHPILFALSIVAAVALAWLGLIFNLYLLRRMRRWVAHVLGAAVLGLVIILVHQLAMAAAHVSPLSDVLRPGMVIDQQFLGILISVAILVMASLLLMTVMDRRFNDVSASLSDSEQRFQVLAETSENGIFTCNEAFDYTNPAMAKITGYSQGELYQMPVNDLLGFVPAECSTAVSARQPMHEETFITTKDGQHRWLYVTLGRLPSEGHNFYLGSVFDITERKQMEQELRYLAFNDPLTELPNRKFFMNRLNALLADETGVDGLPDVVRVGSSRAPFALMFVDVNRFKLINDNFGLSKGDLLLKVIANRIRSTLPQATLVARVGGDEFAVLLQGAHQVAMAKPGAERLHEAFEHAFCLGDQEFFLSLSVGIAFHHASYTEAEQVYRDAMLAKEQAKHRNQSQSTCVFDSRMHKAGQGRLQLENDLRQALQEETFELFYQPVVTLPEGDLRGFEALIRWRRSDGSLVFPGEFIALAEDTGLINRLGDWILKEACRQVGAWNRGSGMDREYYVSVNLSSVQFFQMGLIETVRTAMAQHGVLPGQLKLELTESILVDDNPQVIERMHQLLAMGCSIMIDDFGTGYSSLSYLQRFPLDVLKIDQSFVAEIDHPTGRHLVRAIIAMAHALELGVIAEGIETSDTAEKLAALGCHVGQGYHFARPLTARAATEYFKTHKSASERAFS